MATIVILLIIMIFCEMGAWWPHTVESLGELCAGCSGSSRGRLAFTQECWCPVTPSISSSPVGPALCSSIWCLWPATVQTLSGHTRGHNSYLGAWRVLGREQPWTHTARPTQGLPARI